MKLLALFGLLAVAFAAWPSRHNLYNGSEKSFTIGKTYVFEYNGQIVNGIPVKGVSTNSIQYAKANALITVGERHWTMRLQEPRFFNSKINMEEPREMKMHNIESLEETKMEEEMMKLLSLPVRFRYHNGIVSEIHFVERDNAWSENIKRAVLNMLQVQLSPKMQENESMNRETEYVNKHFTQPERTIEGECEVAYSVVEGENRFEKEITKSINFEKCAKRVDIRYGLRFTSECEMCESQDSRPESQTVINYKINGDEQNFLIKEVTAKSEYIFSLLSKEQQMLATYTTQMLHLIKIVDGERQPEENWGTKSNLMYNYKKELAYEHFWMTGDSESWKKAEFDKTPKKELIEKQINSILRAMEESEKDGVKLETTRYIGRIISYLRMCNREEMLQIHREICESTKFDREQAKKVNEIMADCLAIAGTAVTVEHLVEKIEKQQISALKASLALKALPNARVSSEAIVRQLLRLSKSSVARSEPVLRQSALLTSGAMMHALCARNSELWAVEISGAQRCTRETKMEWLSLFKTMFAEASSEYEKVLVLKTIANAGLDVSVHFLEDIILSRRESPVVRITAIDGLRLIREQMPRKVHAMLLPLFKNRRESQTLRMAAAVQMIHSKPSLPLLEQFVDALNRENKQQLKAFGYSLLTSFTKSENPCEKQLSEDIVVALRGLRSRPSLESFHSRVSGFWPSLDLGLSGALLATGSNESVIPREVRATLDSLFGGQWTKSLFELGFAQQNLDSVLLRIASKLEDNTEYVPRGLRSQKTLLAQAAKDIARQMKISARKSEINGQPFGMLYIRYKNIDYAVLPIEEHVIEKATGGMTSFKEMIRELTKGIRFESTVTTFFYERTRVFATSMGIPVAVSQKMPTLATIKVQLKAEFDSTKPTLRTISEPSVASTHVTSMLAMLPFQHSGARLLHSIQSTLPVNLKFEYDLENQKLSAVIKPPKKEKRLFLIETRPVAFVRSFSARSTPLTTEKTIVIPHLERTSVHYEREYAQEASGIKFEVFGSVHRGIFEQQLPAVLYGQNHVQFTIVPSPEALKELVIEIKPRSVSKNDLTAPRYDSEFEGVSFRLEDSEENNDYETEAKREQRHSASRRYFTQQRFSSEGHELGLEAKVFSVGGPKKFEAQAIVSGHCDSEGKFCRVNLDARRVPLLEGETREWTLEAKAELVLPQNPKSLRELREQTHREIQSTIEMRWGSDEKNSMKIKLQLEQDKQMQKLIRDMLISESEKDSRVRGLSEYDILKEAARLNKANILVQHDLSKQNEKTWEKLFSLLKAEYFFNSNVEAIHGKKGSVIIRLTIDAENRRRLSLQLETSEERVEIDSIRLPVRVPLPSIAQKISFTRKIAEFSKSATCEVSTSKVSTFDDVVYRAPLTSCWSVLAKDCSEEPEFIVLMKLAEKDSEKKMLKVHTYSKDIEVELVSGEIVCKVNGRVVEDEQKLRDFDIELIGEHSVEIRVPKMAIRFDGFKAEMRADKRLQNTHCGMCGHFDGDRENDFRKADNEETDDLEEFHRSWIKKDAQCQPEEYKLNEKKNYRVEAYDEQSYENYDDDYELVKKVKNTHQKNIYRDEEEATYEPTKKIIVVERESKVCFSLEPVPACRKGDEVVEKESMKVKLGCEYSESRRAQKIQSAIRADDDAWMMVKDLEVSFTENVRVPTLCRVY